MGGFSLDEIGKDIVGEEEAAAREAEAALSDPLQQAQVDEPLQRGAEQRRHVAVAAGR